MFSRPKKQRNTLVDRRILHIHQFMADKVLAEPALFDHVQQVLEQRYAQKLMRYGCYMLWHSVLELRHDPEAFKAQLLSDDERWQLLRRSTIFTGVLNEEEREHALASSLTSA